MAVVGHGRCGLRLDAAGCGAAGVGIFGVAEDTEEEEDRAKNQELGQPQDFDVCSGGRIRSDPAVVDSRGATFGKDSGGALPLSRAAVCGVVERDTCGCDCAVLEDGYTGPFAR